jgi:phosphoglycolate phosphatase/pyrophosphatase PpaX
VPPSALLVDFDGTIADTLPLCVAAFQACLLRHTGRAYTEVEIVSEFGVTEEGMLRRMVPAGWEACLASYLDEYQRSHRLCPEPFAGLPEALARVRARGVKVGLVTGKGPVSLRMSLEKFGLADGFDEVRFGSPERGVKVEQITELVGRFGAGPGRAAYLGDHPGDVRAARGAGVLALAATWAPGVELEALVAERPDALLRTPGELEAWVERWMAAAPA